ncbi:MAG: glycosyltransferase family 2 protein [Limnothrix sp.]
MKTPVAFLIFNRPDTTQRVFEAIRQAKPPILLVVADGPRGDRPEEAKQCAATRAIIETIDWDCEVLKNYSEANLGCKNRVSSGLDWVFEQVEEAIILEDDCLPDLSFFPFCEELLEKYRDNPKIMAISGDNFQFGRKRTEHSYYFSIYNHCWGWASWRRAWKYYDRDMTSWKQAKEKKLLNTIFSNYLAKYYWHRKFEQTYQKKYNTWDYQWTFTCWAKNGLTVLPEVNLVSNIGFNSQSTHTSDQISPYSNMPTSAMKVPLEHPPSIIRCKKADDFTQNTKFGLISRASQKIKTLIKNTFNQND